MKLKPLSLDKIQRLIVDIQKVERNHRIPNSERHENVAEHSFSVAILCWRIFEAVKPPLDLTKILQYALVHDFSERGSKYDINTYASTEERNTKKQLELAELKKISDEFKDFKNLVEIINDYEKAGQEALFVWSVDKMQSIILGEIDDWRPYVSYGVTYKQFFNKGEEFLNKCSPYVKDIFKEVFDSSCDTYYDNPNKKSLV